MTDTKTLIARLSSEVNTPAHPLSPAYWGTRLIVLLIVYAIGTQFYLGLRPDLALQITRPAFAAETALLLALLLSSAAASVLAMYPDAYQKPRYLLLPHAALLVLAVLVVLQMFVPPDTRMVIPAIGVHTLECVVCIGSVALVPAALIFIMLRKGASVRQLQAGSFAVLAASTVGCLTLRLAEADDSVLHLAIWHYLPTLFFAAVGAIAGKWLLKW